MVIQITSANYYDFFRWNYKLCYCFRRILDHESLKAQAEEGALMGYTGKQCIHPIQVPIVQAAFTPAPEKVEWATQLIQAFEEHQGSGKVRDFCLQFASLHTLLGYLRFFIIVLFA